MMNQDERLREMMNTPEIPKELLPENMKQRLDEMKRRQKIQKRSRIVKWTAGLTACGVLAGTATYFGTQLDVQQVLTNRNGIDVSYMETASNYRSVYRVMKKASEQKKYYDYVEEVVYEDAAVAEEEAVETSTSAAGVNEGGEEHSVTHDQEQGIHEADMVQTDGEYIYTANEHYDTFFQTRVADGKMMGYEEVDLSDYVENGSVSIHSMYLTKDRLILLADVYDYELSKNESEKAYVFVFQTGETPQLLGTYSQSGAINDVRMMEDGTVYLISDYWYEAYGRRINYEKFLPVYTCDEERNQAEPEQILLPSDDVVEEGKCEPKFTNIGSLNVKADDPCKPIDFCTLAGFDGILYCSQDNIYLADRTDFYEPTTSTMVTKLNIHDGEIEPTASVEVPGYIKDQFSMSEYQGNFRIAVTEDGYQEENGTWTSRSNSVYVYNADLQQIGCITKFGKNENIRSVNFSGDMAYVVTYRQTDPLFAIDLSDPTDPRIRDAYKINGYSTYMQKWDENHLLGFGINADENGIQDGYKLVMFDTTNPDELKEVGFYPITEHDIPFISSHNTEGWLHSRAASERKMLLIAPEKNLIGVPFTLYDYGKDDNRSFYEFFRYEDNELIPVSKIDFEKDTDFCRAVYIGDYIYLASTLECVAVSMDTMEVTDSLVY